MTDAFYSITDRESVRRQFRMSVVMVVAMAIGAYILGFATPIAQMRKATMTDDSVPFTGRLVTMIDE